MLAIQNIFAILLNDITFGTYSFLEEPLQARHLWINIEKIKQWVSKENIDSNLTPLSFEITGERVQTVISVIAFRTFEHLRLVSLFSRFYCKGKEK